METKGEDGNMNSMSQSILERLLPWLSPNLRTPQDNFYFRDIEPDYLEDDLRFDDIAPGMNYEDAMTGNSHQRMEAGDLGNQQTAVADLDQFSIIKESKPSLSFGPTCSGSGTSHVFRRHKNRKSVSETQARNRQGDESSFKVAQRHEAESLNVAEYKNSTAFGTDSSLNKNFSAKDQENEEKKKAKQEKDHQILMLLQQKKAEKDDETNHDLDVRIAAPISTFEQYSLGPPYDTTVQRIPVPNQPNIYLRHKDEIAGVCCERKQCRAYAEIHKMSAFFEDAMFQEDKIKERANYACNQSLTTNLTILEVLIEVALTNQATCAEEDRQRRKELYGIDRNPLARCLFCAKRIQVDIMEPGDGCDNVLCP
ncbi:hypothetical protein PoB_006746700 [Plakobranchus ocellatus]|uniref:Uncharacterized protein n=1 Tax=Plakobranchus ocellatus TaxID=259542 RepID=A0AAV4D9U6_9GAST|nr:hypothetical protein PoB_006746700 [Plakobranchus ocellatus]